MAELRQIRGPYEAWTFGPFGSRYMNGESFRVDRGVFAGLLETPPKHEWLREREAFDAGPGETILTPTLWKPAYEGYAGGDACFLPIVFVRQPIFEMDGGTPRARVEPGFRLNAPIDEASLARTPFGEPDWSPDPRIRTLAAKPAAGRAPLVVMAVIDDGVSFAHRAFMGRDGAPRVEFCWVQAGETPETEPSVLYGRELTRPGIARLIDAFGSDEDALYRAAGSVRPGASALQPMAGLSCHGAHVLDLAAGHEHGSAETGTDLDRMRIIGVELPPASVADTVGFGKDGFVLAAFHYIFERADRIEKAYGVSDLPLVVNFSFGFSGGPHDGSDRLEEAIRNLVMARRALGKPTRLVMPAGNNFQSALNGVIGPAQLEPDSMATVHWRVQPCDRTSNYLEIWLPADEAAEPDLPDIIDPGGRKLSLGAALSTRAQPTQRILPLRDERGETVGQVSVDHFRGFRWRLMVILAPTEPNHGWLPGAMAGLWRIRIRAGGIVGEGRSIACRIQRDMEFYAGATGARQSYFDPPGESRYGPDGAPAKRDAEDGFIRRFGTVNGLATHDAVTVVAGYVESTLANAPGRPDPAPYSSAAPLLTSGGRVHCSAPSDIAPSLPGRRAAGVRSGSSARLVGTSAAAPQVARRIAVAWLEGGDALDELEAPMVQGRQQEATEAGNGPAFRARLGRVVLTDRPAGEAKAAASRARSPGPFRAKRKPAPRKPRRRRTDGGPTDGGKTGGRKRP